MKIYFKKILVMFVMVLGIMGGYTINAFADNTSESIKINNTRLNFNKIIYVDVNKGNDDIADGTIEKPYKNVDTAINKAQSGNAIFIKAGLYNLKPMYLDSYVGAGVYDQGKELTIIGENEKTILEFHNSDATESRDGEAFCLTNNNSKVMNLKYNFYPSKSTNYSNAIFTLSRGSYYNLFINVKGGVPASYSYYNDNPIDTPKVYNSIFYHETNTVQQDYSGNPYYENCLSNCSASYGRKVTCVTKSFNINNLSLLQNDVDIKNIGTGTNPDGTKSNVGVYGGKFAWRTTPLTEENVSLNKSSLNLKEGTSEKLTATTTPSAVDIDWSSSDESVATVDSNGNIKAIKEGLATITAKIKGTDIKSTCIVTVTKKDVPVEPEQPTNPEQEYIINTAYAKGDNTNNASGQVSIIFKGVAEAQLKVIKTADVDSVYVGDNFIYTIEVTNTSDKIAKSVVIKDNAPNHIQFIPSKVITTQGKVDSSSTAKNIVVNVGDIPPLGTVTIKIPVLVVE
ncbi:MULTISPECIES: Ig-like domain-containing protein [unclassified Clostridium]|uniref:Ig-like domain-containing protein n=1 Tax=unclassified Clostridium TaxID=2614128 RepID=UPI00207ABD92|nr:MULTISPECIES: Ig-like domain-containing protein [unclassified Clostridium]